MNMQPISRLALLAALCTGAGAVQAHEVALAVPAEQLEGVETVTMDTAQGPVVVVSFPVSGNVAESNYNIDFTVVDADNDGYISRDEAQAVASRSDATRNLVEQFSAADVTDDGRLGFAEIIDWAY